MTAVYCQASIETLVKIMLNTQLKHQSHFLFLIDIIGQAANLEKCTSICSFCSRMKRGKIYACARREGYNVIALGQHLDDLTERFVSFSIRQFIFIHGKL